MTTLTLAKSTYADPSLAAIELYISLVTSFFSLSLAENALVTGLIITKILTVYRDIQGLESRVGYANGLGRDIIPIIYILIESGVITFMAQLVQTLMYKFANNAYPVLAGPIFQLYVRSFTVNCCFNGFDYIYPIIQGISMAIVLLRVEMGLTYEVDNRTSIMRFATTSNHDTTLP